MKKGTLKKVLRYAGKYRFLIFVSMTLAIVTALLWIVTNWIVDYVIDIKRKGFCSPLYYYGAQIIQFQYEFYRVLGSLKNKSLGALYKGMIFNRFQIKFGMANEAFRIKKLIWSFLAVFMVVIAYYQYFVK